MDDPQRPLPAGDVTGWFERLYAAAETGRAVVPWDRAGPHPLLTDWAQTQPRGDGKRALVVGCGFGYDAELISGIGYRVIAFDISPTAIRGARERFPDSDVDYRVADLLDPPPHWAHAFDLVVDVYTVQSLPREIRRDVIGHIGQFVRGRLLVIAAIQAAGEPLEAEGPPWPLTRAELDMFTDSGLTAESVERIELRPEVDAWRAEFTRR